MLWTEAYCFWLLTSLLFGPTMGWRALGLPNRVEVLSPAFLNERSEAFFALMSAFGRPEASPLLYN